MTLMVHYHKARSNANKSVPDIHQDTYSKNVLGFWMYLMTDCILFTTLFATYAVLHHQTFGGPTSREIYQLPVAFIETMILLVSTVVCGFAVISAVKEQKKYVLLWLGVTFVLGLSFIFLEWNEFRQLIEEGNSWKRSAFLSSFFTLVGTHGAHVSAGLLWILVLMGQIFVQGVTVITFRRLVIFSMFWHFLDLVWIFIFTFVYLLGVL